MNSRCVVVIGHVDHGKTTLVRSITGMETDRLPEEKQRGLSITPGFAHRRYPTGTIDIIDAPGHEDFIPALVGAASGAGAALVVISAIEGIGAQTIEHLRIAHLLGLRQAVFALTKSDLVYQLNHTTCLAEIKAAVAQTPFHDAPMVLCSAQAGTGLDALHLALEGLLERPATQPSPPDGYFAIDRTFSHSGRGTIVTGTVLGGSIAVDDHLTLYPAQRSVMPRGLQRRGKDCRTVQAGERAAINLRGVSLAEVKRGDVLGQMQQVTTCVDVQFEMLPQVKPLKHMQEIRVLFGTTNAVAQVRLYKDGAQKAPFAQLRFRKSICGFAGQRAILRQLSPAQTLGGAVFLNPSAHPTRAGDPMRLRLLEACQSGNPAHITMALISANGGLAELSEVARLSRLTTTKTRATLGTQVRMFGEDTLSTHDHITLIKVEFTTALQVQHDLHPLRPMIPRTQLTQRTCAPALQKQIEQDLLEAGHLRIDPNGIALTSHDPVANLSKEQTARMAQIEKAFRDAALAPLPHATLFNTASDKDLIALLVDLQRLIPLRNVALKQTLMFHSAVFDETAETLRKAFPPPKTFITGAARSALNTSRRVIVPLLEHFDVSGVTLRTGDIRQMKP